MILSLAVKDPEAVKKLEQLGIDAKDRTIEAAMDASMASKVINKGDPIAYKALKEEAYGKNRDRSDSGFSLNLSIDSAHFGGEYVVDGEVHDE